MTSPALSALAPHFFQLAYVVRDLPAAEAWFREILGVPAWFRMENVTLGAGCTFRGRPSDSVAHLSLGWMRGTQVELIEPVRGESLYSEFLQASGPGLHHIGFDVPDFGTTVSALRESGLELLAAGRVGPGSEFAYFDCDAAGASVVEILGFDAAVRSFMEQLRSRSEEKRADARSRG